MRNSTLPLLASVMVLGAVLTTAIPAQTGLATARERYSRGLGSNDSEKRKRAIAEFARCGHPEAVRNLLGDVQKIAKKIAQMSRKLEKLGIKLNKERTKRMGPYAGKASYPVSLRETVERALEPIRKDIGKLESLLGREEEVRDALGEGIGSLIKDLEDGPRTKAVNILVLSLKGGGKPEQEVEVIRALRFVDHAAVRSALSGYVALADSAAVRVAALESLAQIPHESSEGAALRAMADEHWQVQVSALKLLRLIGGKESIQPLIETLDRAEGRLIDEVVATLRHLTKVNFHDNAALWREWWSKSAGIYEGRGAKGGVPAGAGDTASPVAGDRAQEGEGTYFYGIRTRSTHIIYVLDVSGSMNWAVDVKVPPSTHRGVGPRPPDAPVGKRKIDDALSQLVLSVAALPAKGSFNIVIYSEGVRVYKKKMVISSKRNKTALRKWAKKVTALGATNIFDALEKAFSLVGRGAFDKRYKVTADTIYFLSDGVPTVGRTLSADEILRQVRRWNEFQKVKVHTVGLGESIDPDFMRMLAEQTGGQFVHKKK